MRYPYLNDRTFLKMFDNEKHKIQYTRITVLDFQTEEVIASIEGKSTGGSVNLSGTSNMRRAGSCSLLVDPEGIKKPGYNGEYVQYNNITEVENLISLNKKIRLETGFDNSLAAIGYYEEHNIIWFPLGTFVITNASISKNNSGINISLTLNDKCALINGDMGGTIPASTIFSEMESYDSISEGRLSVDKILIKDVIKSLLVEFGGERPENVIVTDIPDTIVKVVKWRGKTKLYFYSTPGYKHFSTTLYQGVPNPKDPSSVIEGDFKESNGIIKWETSEDVFGTVFQTGQDVGYMNEAFVYPGTLECSAGEAVTAVLDKIKNVLGNFEWFYDIDGRFVFQKIRNNINENTEDNFLSMQESDYLTYYNQTGIVYTFDNTNLITSIANNPQYKNIKNDFIVWGTKKSVSGAELPIRYHLSFNNKPNTDINKLRLALVYKDYKGLWQPKFLKEDEVVYGPVPSSGADTNKIYLSFEDPDEKQIIKIWDKTRNAFMTYKSPDYEICFLSTEDWRTELYYRGLEADNKTFDKNYYAAELNAEWPKIKNIKNIKKRKAFFTTPFVKNSDNTTYQKIIVTNENCLEYRDKNIIIPIEIIYAMHSTENAMAHCFPIAHDILSRQGDITIKISSERELEGNLRIYLRKFTYNSDNQNYTLEKSKIIKSFSAGIQVSQIKLSYENLNITDLGERDIVALSFVRGTVNIGGQDLGLKINNDENLFITENYDIYQDDYYTTDTNSYDYWLDFLEGDGTSNALVSQFNTSKIGRRTKIVSDNSVNSIFPIEPENIVIINADGDNLTDLELVESKRQEAVQVPPDIFSEFSIGGGGGSAYEKVKELIFTHTQYNETVSLSVVPIYYLDVNELISVFDNDTAVNGEYLIKSISLPLTPNGTSNISATKALVKTI